MALNEQNRNNLVTLYWDKAIQTQEEAEVAIANEKWSMSANRIYYMLFHAVTALFVKNGLKVGTHRGAKVMLGEYFVLPGKISPDQGRLFAQLETMRDKADYDIIYSATQTEVMTLYPQATAFLATIKELLGEN